MPLTLKVAIFIRFESERCWKALMALIKTHTAPEDGLQILPD